MAIHTVRTDDLTGESGATLTVITVNGKGIEIDLAPNTALKLSDALAEFWSVGTEHDYAVTKVERGGRRRRAAGTEYEPAEVRAWATRHGIDVPARGRIPRPVLDQFAAANDG